MRKGVLALALSIAACRASAPVVAPVVAAPRPPQVPLFYAGHPVGGIRGARDVWMPHRGFARLTMRAPVEVTLDDARWPASGSPAPPKRAFDVGEHVVEAFEVCLDPAVVPLALRRAETAAWPRAKDAPTTLTVQGHPFTVDHVALCFDDGDLARPLILVTSWWDAPDGTRIFIEGANDSTPEVRMWSDPPLPGAAVLGLLL